MIATPVATQPTSIALALAGATPIVSTPDVDAPAAMALTVTGAVPVVSAPALSLPASLALAFTGSAPAITLPVLTQPQALALAFTGTIPSVSVGGAVVVHPGWWDCGLSFATPVVEIENTAPVPSRGAWAVRARNTHRGGMTTLDKAIAAAVAEERQRRADLESLWLLGVIDDATYARGI